MAQRTGVDGLIAPRAKTASVGRILTLAVAAALFVSGCGGDSDIQTASPPRSETETTSAVQAKSGTSPSPAAEAVSGSKPTPSAPSAVQGGGSGGKHGTHIELPKGEPESGPTPAEEREATVADITLTSSAVSSSEAALPATYTCDGKDSWPELSWQGVPPGTEELALFAMNVQPVEGKLFFDWAVMGLDPDLQGLEAGRLPGGAVTGRNSFGQANYSICPAKGEAETYVFALFALPERLPGKNGFDPRTLRDQILNISGNVGLMAASYARS